MITVYGFHIDFQFRPYLTLLGRSQMVQSPRNHKMDWEQSGMVQNEIFWIQRLDFEYTQLLPSPVLKNLKFWTFWTPLVPICMRKRGSEQPGTIHPSLGPPFFDISRNLSKFLRDYEKSKHRCLYLVSKTNIAYTYNWFLNI